MNIASKLVSDRLNISILWEKMYLLKHTKVIILNNLFGKYYHKLRPKTVIYMIYLRCLYSSKHINNKI